MIDLITATSLHPAASISGIEERIAPLRSQLAAHPLYGRIQTSSHLRIFMESHVFAVWDFMSLLKSLQQSLTCVEIPWVPTASPASRRFINEIVLGEESDEYQGRPVSHFEVYLEAMERAGASTAPIRQFIQRIRTGQHVERASQHAEFDWNNVPTPAKSFVEETFHVIRNQHIAAQAAAFTFGREDAIPDMFRSLVRDLNRRMDGDLAQFVWYLERHIEVDGDEHGPLSLQMVEDLCGTDLALWQIAGDAAVASIQARLALWDGILAQIDRGSH